MKKLVWVLAFVLAFSSVTFCQVFFTCDQFSVKNTDIRNKPSPMEYPYLAVSVLFRNEEKLVDQDFLQKFKDLRFFYTEIKIKHEMEEYITPLYLLEKKEIGGTLFWKSYGFDISIFNDKTVASKIPVSVFDNEIPTITLKMDMRIKDEMISIIKELSETISPVVTNPSSIFGPGAAANCYKFFSDVLTQISADQEVHASVEFGALTPQEREIKPYEYNIVLIKPSNKTVNKTNLHLAYGQDKVLKLYDGAKEYKDYPYFIVETGLSNYLDDDKSPSHFFGMVPGCNVSPELLDKLTESFGMLQNRFSLNQSAAEKHVLNLARYYVDIKEGANNKENEDALIKAYNAYFDFKINPGTVEENLYTEHYKKICDKLEGCISTNARLLERLGRLDQVISILNKRETLDNKDLGTLNNYIEFTKSTPVLLKTSFYGAIKSTIDLNELEIYDNMFLSTIRNLREENNASERAAQLNRVLSGLKNDYSNCKMCQENVEDAQQYYARLLRNDEDLRQEMIAAISSSGDLVQTTNNKINVINDFDLAEKTEFNNLNSLLELLYNAKLQLDQKLLLPGFNSQDKSQIRNLISTSSNYTNQINAIVEEKIKPVLENLAAR